MTEFKELQNEVNGSLYIMASTLNQMVNYIPYKLFHFSKVWNITTDDEKNEKWDKYFETSFPTANKPDIKHIKFKHSEILKIGDITERLEDKLDEEKDIKKVFWNLTGGQRPFLFAVYDYVKTMQANTDISHYLCYLEGNTGELRIMHYKKGVLQNDFTNGYEYLVDSLTIEIAFKLMGYKPNGTPQNVLGDNSLNGFYDIFFPEYRKATPNLRTIMADFNIQNSGVANFNDVIDNKFPTTVSSLSKNDIKQEWDNYKNRKAFGYILEDMFLYLLLKIIDNNKQVKDKIAGVYSSVKLSVKGNYRNDDKTIDEFDTMILTKTGQIICFECKSGSMDKNNAKSTKFSTYAISGVYGQSILITPQINETDFINDKIKDTIESAKRANLEIWYLDEIETKIKEKLK